MSEQAEPTPVTVEEITSFAMPTPTAPPPPVQEKPPIIPTPAKPPVENLPTDGPRPGDLDEKGNAWNPEEHAKKMNRKTGVWMPKGGRKSKPAVQTSKTGYIPDQPPPAEDETEAAKPADAKIDQEEPTGAPPEATTRAAAKVGAKALQTLTGMATGAPEEAKMGQADESGFIETLSAYLESKGIRFVGLGAFLLVTVGYFAGVFTKPKSGAAAAGWFKKTPKPAPPVNAPAPIREAPPRTDPTPAPSSAAAQSQSQTAGL